MRVALVQLTSSDDPGTNLPTTLGFIEAAASRGADLILTPEVTNCVSASRARQEGVLRHEADDPTLAAIREAAARLERWILIGSLALKTGDADGRFANRSFLIAPDGAVTARYDKIHMFDAAPSATESYAESKGYRPGTHAVVAEAAGATLGLTICYDLRFPHLYRALAKAGAKVLTAPSAFSPVTGAAHWEVLCRARAIETGCFLLAPAQTGTHAGEGRTRRTHGHGLAVSPWGEVLADCGDAPGVTVVDLSLDDVEAARVRVASLHHDRPYEGP